MLPSLPSLPADWAVLQHWFGAAAFLAVLATIIFKWRDQSDDFSRGAKASTTQAESTFASIPRIYVDGALKEAFEIFDDLIESNHRIECKMDWMIAHRARRVASDQPPDRAPPRRGRARI